jgi:hypothetical protein
VVDCRAGAGRHRQWPLLADEGSPFTFTTLRGETTQIYGQGLYRYDTIFTGAGFKGQDIIMLILGIPLLVLSIRFYQRGSLRGGVLLMGVLGYVLYVYASMALGAADIVLTRRLTIRLRRLLFAQPQAHGALSGMRVTGARDPAGRMVSSEVYSRGGGGEAWPTVGGNHRSPR